MKDSLVSTFCSDLVVIIFKMPPKKDNRVSTGSSIQPAIQGDSENSISNQMQSVTLTNEQFQMLINKFSMPDNVSDLLNQERARSETPVSRLSDNTFGSFVKCTARFSGSENSDVDAFLDNVLTFKDCTRVTDENAIRGLSMLLEGTAATWWQGVKGTITNWDDAVKALQDVYSKKLPPHLVFREIFSREQNFDESTELFVCRIRALIAQLTYLLQEEIQLDMIYGLLHRKIKKRLPRNKFSTFKELLENSRDIEASLQESSTAKERTDFEKIQPKEAKKSFAFEKKIRPRCAYCKNFGHEKDSCRKLKKESEHKPEQVVNDDTSTKLVCYGCGKPGVVRSKCPVCQGQQGTSSSGIVHIKALDFNEISIPPDIPGNGNIVTRPLLPLKIGDAIGVGFADSGAQVTIAGHSLYKILLDNHYEFSKSKVRLSYADGNLRNEEILQTTADVTIQNRVVPTTFTVLPHLQDNHTLLGVDFLDKAGIVLNIPENCWFFYDLPTQKFNFVNEFNVPPNLQVFEVNEVHSLRKDEGESLDIAQRQKFNKLLNDNADIFKTGGGPTDFAIHRIITRDHEPICVPPYPMSISKKEFLRKELDRLLAEEIIEECESSWGSPVVLVPKKDGSWRLCVDYRKLNAITDNDSYPMPRIEDLLSAAKRTLFMSTIDLQSGYWQVAVAPEDRDKTCFVTPFGTFRFNRMPFGLKNAPLTFVRLVDKFRAGLGDRAVFAYMDDFLILSKSFDEHLNDIQAVFDRLRLFNLRARRDKCWLVRTSINYLGHLITQSGIEPNPEKISAIKDLKPPKNVKQLQSFIQTCSWFRKFVPKFSEIARPLTNLLKKNSVFVFGPKELSAYELLKDKLTSAPVLVQADQTKPYILRTDASDYAIGAALLQGEGNEERPIEYSSRLLNSSEKNYSVTEREALAIVWSTEKFRTYLEGSEVTIITDHQPLKWLFSIKTPSGRLARWALKLQGLNMKIIYTQGKANFLADMLSRPFTFQPTTKDVCLISVEMPKYTYEDIRIKQMADKDILKIIEAFEKNDPIERTRWAERGYLLQNGVLYRFNPDMDTDDPQLVIPESERAEIMKQYHDSPTAGHYGVERTLQKILSKFYFTGMRRYISDYIKNCLECQRYKATNLKPSGLLQTPAPGQRFEIIAVDLFGPLPETNSHNRWILICEDTASKWVELFALKDATSEACAKVLIEELFLRYGTPRKMITDNGVQFISDVMQKVTYCFGIKTPFIPLYHAESNPVERKNRDLKTQLSILVKDQHNTWDDHISSIRFAINSTVCKSVGHTPAFLTFGRELRAPNDNLYDLRQVVDVENFVPRITPYLRKLTQVLQESKEILTHEQDHVKKISDNRRVSSNFNIGDKVLVKTHVLSSKQKGISSKFAPKRDGPYLVKEVVTPTTYLLTTCDKDRHEIGRYHARDIYLYHEKVTESSTSGIPTPLLPKRKRGRPKRYLD